MVKVKKVNIAVT